MAADVEFGFDVLPAVIMLQLGSFLPLRRPGLIAGRCSESTSAWLDLFSTFSGDYRIDIASGSQDTVVNEDSFNPKDERCKPCLKAAGYRHCK